MILEVIVSLLLLSPMLYLALNCVVPWALGEQNLRDKYQAKWALVTGGSSGIGKELCRKLLMQGLNVVVVARDEPVFQETIEEFQALFPGRDVRPVKANLSDPSGKWMDDVRKETDDVEVQIVFGNAGFILTGFFEQQPIEAHLANMHCNLTANVILTRHFYGRMVEKGLRGCVVYTSSSAGFIPNPFAAMYGCTKAAVSEMAASLAVEGRGRGIHVHAVHPSPVNSRFTSGGGSGFKVHRVAAFDMAYKFATGPEALPSQIFSAVGRSPVMVDLGGTSVGLRLGVQLLGYNTMAFLFSLVAPATPDYRKYASPKTA